MLLHRDFKSIKTHKNNMGKISKQLQYLLEKIKIMINAGNISCMEIGRQYCEDVSSSILDL